MGVLVVDDEEEAEAEAETEAVFAFALAADTNVEAGDIGNLLFDTLLGVTPLLPAAEATELIIGMVMVARR